MMLLLCAEGDERLEVGQRILYTKARELLEALQSIWEFGSINKYTRAAVELSLTLIEGLIDDGNISTFCGICINSTSKRQKASWLTATLTARWNVSSLPATTHTGANRMTYRDAANTHLRCSTASTELHSVAAAKRRYRLLEILSKQGDIQSNAQSRRLHRIHAESVTAEISYQKRRRHTYIVIQYITPSMHK